MISFSVHLCTNGCWLDYNVSGFPGGSVVKNVPAMQETWVGKTRWRRAWQPTPVLLLGESHGQRSLAGRSPWCRTELDTTEWAEQMITHLLKCQNKTCASQGSFLKLKKKKRPTVDFTFYVDGCERRSLFLWNYFPWNTLKKNHEPDLTDPLSPWDGSVLCQWMKYNLLH